MLKVIGIVGSPREGGNTEILVKEAFKVISKEGIDTELVLLSNKKIAPCNACGYCKKGEGTCNIEDDFQEIFPKMVKSDGIILASPVYFGSCTPEMKAFIDRVGYCARGMKERPFKRKVGGPIVVGRRGGQNFTLAQLMYFFLINEMIVPGSTYWNIAFGRQKGDVLKDDEGLQTIREFAENVAWLIRKLEK